jgi:multidrug transporter EmrE-like cation transporter
MMHYWPFVFVFLMTAIGVLGDSFLKLAGQGPAYVDVKWFVVGFVVYALTAFGWFYVLKEMHLSTLGIAYALSNVILLVLVGVFIFGERMSVYEVIGLVLAVVSIILLARFA